MKKNMEKKGKEQYKVLKDNKLLSDEVWNSADEVQLHNFTESGNSKQIHSAALVQQKFLNCLYILSIFQILTECHASAEMLILPNLLISKQAAHRCYHNNSQVHSGTAQQSFNPVSNFLNKCQNN